MFGDIKDETVVEIGVIFLHFLLYILVDINILVLRAEDIRPKSRIQLTLMLERENLSILKVKLIENILPNLKSHQFTTLPPMQQYEEMLLEFRIKHLPIVYR